MTFLFTVACLHTEKIYEPSLEEQSKLQHIKPNGISLMADVCAAKMLPRYFDVRALFNLL